MVLALGLGGMGFAELSPEQLQQLVQEARQQHHLPALAVAVVQGEHTLVGLSGAQPEASFPLGSLSKSMTAAVAVRLAEQGRLQLDRGLGELLPEFPMNPRYQRATLRDLLCHRAGLPPNFAQLPAHPQLEADHDPPPELKRMSLEQLLQSEPQGEPFLYSNLSFVLAARAMERLCDRPWPSLLQEQVFTPLGLSSASLGYRGSPTDPWPHRWQGEQPLAFDPSGRRGNVRLLDGADQVRCSLADLARYAAAHLHRQSRWLSQEGYDQLHHDYGHHYGLGWGVQSPAWARGRVLTHHGSNTFFYATCLIAPGRDLAVVGLTNIGWDEERSNERTRQAMVEIQEQVRLLALEDSL